MVKLSSTTTLTHIHALILFSPHVPNLTTRYVKVLRRKGGSRKGRASNNPIFSNCFDLA